MSKYLPVFSVNYLRVYVIIHVKIEVFQVKSYVCSNFTLCTWIITAVVTGITTFIEKTGSSMFLEFSLGTYFDLVEVKGGLGV